MYQILKKAALEAGQIQLKYFHSDLKITQKSNQHNIVTKVDYECQEIITKTLISELAKKGIQKKDIGFIGEENLEKKGKYLFIIDPLDGTSNYASGFPYFCVSIALFINQIPQYGIIYNPITKEIYFAQKGKGAFKIIGNKKTRLEINPNLRQFLIATHLSSKENIRKKVYNFIPKVFPLIRSNRELGSIAFELCHYCENIFGIVVDGNAKIWDIAAATLILNESGGKAYNWNGKEVFYDFNQVDKAYEFFACRPNYLNKISKLLNS